MRCYRFVAGLLLCGILPSWAQQTAARWVWYPENAAGECVKESRWFRKSFVLPARPTQATLWLMVDDNQELWVNGQGDVPVAASGPAWRRYDLTGRLQVGPNLLAVCGTNGTGPAGVLARLVAQVADGEQLVVSDGSWRASKTEQEGWEQLGFDDHRWVPVRVIGDAFMLPWYGHPLFDVEPFITDAERAAYQRHLATLLAPPERFAAEPRARAAIRPYHGAPALFINDRPRPLVMYRATLDPLSDYGRHLIATFRDAGIHGYAPYVALDKCWTGPGKYDWRTIDEQVRAYLAVDPEAYLDILVRLVPPSWWFDAHPDQMVAYATSDQVDGQDEAGRVLRPSPASRIWRKDAGEAWTALIKHMETVPWGNRVIGWHACYGIYAEWHYFGSWTQQYPDTGQAMTAAFRDYLRTKYGTEAKLQAAWRDPAVTFATAAVPGVKPRQYASLLAFRDPAQEQAVIDYYRCQHAVTADAIEYFGKLAKQASGGRALYGVYYGYFMGVLPQAQGGHLDLLRLLKSPYVDYFVAPYEYGTRLMGMDGRLRSLAHAFNLAGKAHIIEADTRTYLHPREEHGRTQDLTESLAALRREFTTALTEHTGYWYVDFGPEGIGGWFDHPQMMATIKDLYALGTRALRIPRRPVAEVGVICDLDSAYYLADGEGMATAYRLIMDTIEELYRTGAPFDELLLPQLGTADLSRYKVLIFLNTTAMSEAQAAFVQKLRTTGRHALVFLWAPGFTGPDGLSTARVQRATGFPVKLVPNRVAGRMVVTDLTHPLAQGLPTSATWTFTPTGGSPVAGFDNVANWYNPRGQVYMEEHYQQFAFEAMPAGLKWTFATTDAWTDLHWKGTLTPTDGLGLEVAVQGPAAPINLQVVLKDANGAEFVAPVETLTNTAWQPLAYSLRTFQNAPWAKVRPERPALPLTGMKFVLQGVGGIGSVVVQLRNLRTLIGTPQATTAARFGDSTFGPLVTPLPAPGTTVLGHLEGREDGLLAVRGQGRRLTLYCPVPFLPREILRNVLQAAGVHRYDDAPLDIVRADSRYLAIHTREGGRRQLRLPTRAVLRDALTGQRVGEGENVPVTLPPNSTTVWERVGQ